MDTPTPPCVHERVRKRMKIMSLPIFLRVVLEWNRRVAWGAPNPGV